MSSLRSLSATRCLCAADVAAIGSELLAKAMLARPVAYKGATRVACKRLGHDSTVSLERLPSGNYRLSYATALNGSQTLWAHNEVYSTAADLQAAIDADNATAADLAALFA